jgi:hypothetical protein
MEVDVVLTTYGMVAAEHRRGRRVLTHVNWFRIMLDEGVLDGCNMSRVLM